MELVEYEIKSPVIDRLCQWSSLIERGRDTNWRTVLCLGDHPCKI